MMDVLTLNEKLRDKEDLLETIWKALRYFPGKIWDGINYLGNLDVEHHLKIRSKEELYGAFVVDRLMKKIRELKKQLESKNLLLALTHDPLIMDYYRFEDAGLKRVVNLVRDYVNIEVGMVSLFEMDEETSIRVAAHGLGHNQGLKHHMEPIDIMYARLLNGLKIKKDGFCDVCQRKLEHT